MYVKYIPWALTDSKLYIIQALADCKYNHVAQMKDLGHILSGLGSGCLSLLRPCPPLAGFWEVRKPSWVIATVFLMLYHIVASTKKYMVTSISLFLPDITPYEEITQLLSLMNLVRC